MSNELVTKEYLGNAIEFKVINGNVYANANKMAVGFGGSKKLENWKASNKTKEYIDILKASPKFQGTELTIVKQGGIAQEQGTWIHEKLILNFARYLNIEFEIWCDEQIETLLREGHVEINNTNNMNINSNNPYLILNETKNALVGFFDGMNMPKEMIASIAIDETHTLVNHDFSGLNKYLPKSDKEAYHSAYELLKQIGIKRNHINDVLIFLELEEKGSSSVQDYILTEKGKEFGFERPFVNKNHKGYQIVWKNNLKNFVELNLNKIPEDWINQ